MQQAWPSCGSAWEEDIVQWYGRWIYISAALSRLSRPSGVFFDGIKYSTEYTPLGSSHCCRVARNHCTVTLSRNPESMALISQELKILPSIDCTEKVTHETLSKWWGPLVTSIMHCNGIMAWLWLSQLLYFKIIMCFLSIWTLVTKQDNITRSLQRRSVQSIWRTCLVGCFSTLSLSSPPSGWVCLIASVSLSNNLVSAKYFFLNNQLNSN